jgi:hypothetical protein
MRFVAWSATSDWCEYYSDAFSVTRLSTHKWRVHYRAKNSHRTWEVIVTADHVWIEPR